MKEAKAGIGFGRLLIQSLNAALLYVADWPPVAVAALVGGTLSIVLSEAAVNLGQLPAAVAGAICADKAGRLADRIRSSPRPVPFDAFLRDINSLHDAVEDAAATLAPGIGQDVVIAVGIAAYCLVLALGPGPPAEHWLNATAHYRVVWLGLAVLLPLKFIYGAFGGPAKITAACDDVASALNAMRTDAQNKLAPLAVLEQVEALERYVIGIQFGFNLFHVRISYPFLYNCLIQLITVGTIVSPMLLAQMSAIVEDEARADEGSLAQ
jgi:hypothetical protein